MNVKSTFFELAPTNFSYYFKDVGKLSPSNSVRTHHNASIEFLDITYTPSSGKKTCDLTAECQISSTESLISCSLFEPMVMCADLDWRSGRHLKGCIWQRQSSTEPSSSLFCFGSEDLVPWKLTLKMHPLQVEIAGIFEETRNNQFNELNFLAWVLFLSQLPRFVNADKENFMPAIAPVLINAFQLVEVSSSASEKSNEIS